MRRRIRRLPEKIRRYFGWIFEQRHRMYLERTRIIGLQDKPEDFRLSGEIPDIEDIEHLRVGKWPLPLIGSGSIGAERVVFGSGLAPDFVHRLFFFLIVPEWEERNADSAILFVPIKTHSAPRSFFLSGDRTQGMTADFFREKYPGAVFKIRNFFRGAPVRSPSKRSNQRAEQHNGYRCENSACLLHGQTLSAAVLIVEINYDTGGIVSCRAYFCKYL